VQADLQEIRKLLADGSLPAIVQRAVLVRFDELPRLYDNLNRTYECRFSDRIIVTVTAMVRALEALDAGPDAGKLAERMVHQLRAMHDRHGIAVALKPPPVPKAAAKKKSK
jgi:hypothetical protein